MVLDSRFIMEYFYSDKTETKQKATKKLKDLIQRKEGILPTIVIGETIQTICEKIGKEEAEICYCKFNRKRAEDPSFNFADSQTGWAT